MNWRPIETAPKDGSLIILGHIDGSASWPGFWHDGSDNYWKRAGWYDAEDAPNILTAKPCSATHWMPLPDPPDAAISENARNALASSKDPGSDTLQSQGGRD